jgi:DNA-binding CsgD family transcriptional regulator
VAEDVERVQPMSAVPCLMLGVPVALARGQVEDAVRMRVCLAPLEQLLPQIIPSLAPGYLAAVSPLRDLVGASRYDEVAAEVAGLPLPRANRLAQGIVRSYRAASAPPAGVVAPGGATSSPADPLRAVGEGADRGARRPVEALTPREVEVLGRLVAGGTNREIAVELGVSTKTVMHHTMAIYRKLGVRGRAEAVAWALRSGTITAD